VPRDTFDKHGVRRDDKRDGNATLEAGHAQTGQNILALGASVGEGRKPVAEIDNAAEINVLGGRSGRMYPGRFAGHLCPAAGKAAINGVRKCM
jgi:hypothetical protein